MGLKKAGGVSDRKAQKKSNFTGHSEFPSNRDLTNNNNVHNK